MKKTRRKGSKCLNCGLPLKESYDYCPACGQENNDQQISFGSLIKDFFSNYFSLDSRFGRSVKPFFLRPGELTREFMEGKRVKYANPIRLYLVISLVHFFFVSINADRNMDDDSAIVNFGTSNDQDELERSPSDSLVIDDAQKGQDFNIFEDDGWPMSDQEWELIESMVSDRSKDYSVESILDSLGNNQKPFFQGYIVQQIVKILKSDKHNINMAIVKNIPISMFFLMPICALLLKALFRKRLYINHLIHTVHLHSFSFTLLTIYWITQLLFDSLPDEIFVGVFLAISVYIVLSFKRTYQVSFLTATAKAVLVGLSYIALLVPMFLIVILASLLLY